MATELYGHLRVSEAELREHQQTLFAKRVMDVPNDLQIRIEYNADSTQKYVAYGAKGLASSSDGWMIWSFTYNANKQLTLRQTAFDSWDNRASASYE